MSSHALGRKEDARDAIFSVALVASARIAHISCPGVRLTALTTTQAILPKGLISLRLGARLHCRTVLAVSARHPTTQRHYRHNITYRARAKSRPGRVTDCQKQSSSRQGFIGFHTHNAVGERTSLLCPHN